MKSETNKRTVSSAAVCWQREAPCACLRIETSPRESHLFPYQHFVTASLSQSDEAETLRLTFSLHDVEIQGRNLRALLLAIQEFAVKWMRVMPERYHQLETGENGLISRIRIREAKSTE
jgi:hypothetical protein